MAENKKNHKYSHTHIEHHSDGSHTTEHHHEDGKSHKKYASADHDAMLDGMMDHTSAPNPGEEADVNNNPMGGGAAASAVPGAGAPPAAV